MNHPEVVLLVAGASLVVTAVLWRSLARQSARRRVRRLLEAPDPQSRRAALDLVGDGGLVSYAGALLALVSQESDPEVLDAVAELVARTLWEPADKQQLVELRLWARRRLLDDQTAPPPQPSEEPPPLPRQTMRQRRAEPLRPATDPMLRRLEAAVGERVLAIRIQRPDGTVELDVVDREGATAWR